VGAVIPDGAASIPPVCRNERTWQSDPYTLLPQKIRRAGGHGVIALRELTTMYTFISFLGGFAVILAFFLRIRAEAYMDATGNRFNAVDLVWEFTFYIAVFATILAAPMT